MAVKQKELEKLKEEIPYKWREQSVNQRGATMVAYIDARQLFDQLDKVCGPGNWQSDFRLVDNKLYGGIGINVEDSGWVWKWDVGSESNVEKEKGESSDALKRAGIHWGVGRFLYSLGIVTLRSAEYNGKFRPADDQGNILWDREKLSNLCNMAVQEGQLDRTRLKPVKSAPVSTPKGPFKSTNDLPYLNKGTESYDKVVKALTEKKATLDQVQLKYKLSSVVKKELENLV